jgi:hypothetical protein
MNQCLNCNQAGYAENVHEELVFSVSLATHSTLTARQQRMFWRARACYHYFDLYTEVIPIAAPIAR